jgi:hypothetical protein
MLELPIASVCAQVKPEPMEAITVTHLCLPLPRRPSPDPGPAHSIQPLGNTGVVERSLVPGCRDMVVLLRNFSVFCCILSPSSSVSLWTILELWTYCPPF